LRKYKGTHTVSLSLQLSMLNKYASISPDSCGCKILKTVTQSTKFSKYPH